MSLEVDFTAQPAFYSQKMFRKILDSMARPGKVNFIEKFPFVNQTSGMSEGGLYLVGVGYTLLDVEASFHIPGRDPLLAGMASELEFQTGSRQSPLPEADFIFMTAGDDPELLSQAKCGCLNYPDSGATVIIHVDHLSENDPPESGAAMELQLKGPGILGQKPLSVAGLTARHIQILRDSNGEFPLGIDVILVCGNRLTCVPRSVQVNGRRN